MKKIICKILAIIFILGSCSKEKITENAVSGPAISKEQTNDSKQLKSINLLEKLDLNFESPTFQYKLDSKINKYIIRVC